MRKGERAVRFAASTVIVALLGSSAAAQETSKPAPAPAAKTPRALTALASVTRRGKTEQGPYSWTAEYSYDGAGNVTKIGSETFHYDLDSRLTSSTVAAQDRVTMVSQTFAYDTYGNQTSRVTSGTTQDLSTDPATNHLLVMSATYDGAGNLTSINPSGITTYTYMYDGLGMLMTESTGTPSTVRVWNAYTADDERIMTYDTLTQASTMTVRDLTGHVLRRIDRAANGTIKGRDYVYRDGMMLAEYDPATQTSEHFTLDHLGTPRVITDGGGYKIAYHTYQPFGEELTKVNDAAQEGEPKKFTGHERDAALAGGDTWQLDYMHARFYTSSLGRFLSVDPNFDKDTMLNPQKWNRYSYVHNNPINLIDPDGKQAAPGQYYIAGQGWTNASPLEHRLTPEQERQMALQHMTITAALAAPGLAGPLRSLAFESSLFLMRNPAWVLAAYKMLDAMGGNVSGGVNPTGQTGGKLGYLLGSVESQASQGKAGFFAGVLGFGEKTLDAAIRSHFADNFKNGVLKDGRLTVTGAMTGANGVVAMVKTVWQWNVEKKVWDLITAVPTR